MRGGLDALPGLGREQTSDHACFEVPKELSQYASPPYDRHHHRHHRRRCRGRRYRHRPRRELRSAVVIVCRK